MIEKIIETGKKVDFHIHSIASKHKESDDCVDLSTLDNIDLLIKKLNQREINMCSISDHDNFDFDIYNRLKKEENKGSIKKVFPAVEFSVTYEKRVLHIITIFDDKDEEKIKKIQNEIFNVKNNKPFYDDTELNSFSESKYLNILKNIDLNVVMIAHQNETLSSKETRNHDVMSLGEEKFDELVFLDYFESFEFKRKRNEIFNKNYISVLKNKEEKSNAFNKITNFDICVIEATSKSLNFKNVSQATITSINSKIKKIGKIVEYFESIDSLLNKIQENAFFDKED